MIDTEVLAGDRMPPPVAVTGVLYKLNGVSQPSIVKGSDGRLYVLKCNGFPGPDGLANEVIGAELIRRFGLPAPEWRTLHLSDDFIERNPEIWFHSSSGKPKIRPAAGRHFGSLLLTGNGTYDVCYQVIPRSWWKRVRNRQDFIGMLVLDLWACNGDRRQAVFVRSGTSKGLSAVFIDNDHLLGGRWGKDEACPRRVMWPDLSAYIGLPLEKECERWARLVASIEDGWIDSVLDRIPAEWRTDAMMEAKRARLRQGRCRLERLICEAIYTLKTSYSVEFHRAVGATTIPHLQLPPASAADQLQQSRGLVRNAGFACPKWADGKL